LGLGSNLAYELKLTLMHRAALVNTGSRTYIGADLGCNAASAHCARICATRPAQSRRPEVVPYAAVAARKADVRVGVSIPLNWTLGFGE